MADKIAILGMGNVGLHLTKAFSEANMEVYFWNRSKIASEELNFIPNAIKLNGFDEIPQDTKLCIICVSEDSILSIAEKLGGFSGIVAHSSGSLSISLLEKYLSKVAVIYPLQTFSKSRILNYSEIPVFLEANDKEVYAELEVIVNKVFPKTNFLNSKNRIFLHLAAVFTNNFVNACVMAAKDVSDENKINFSLFNPLINETLSKVKDLGPEYSQTGPAVRKNQKIIEMHIDLLSKRKDLKEIYEKVSAYITNRFK